MPDIKPTAPLDLSVFDDLEPPPAQLPAVAPVAQPPMAQDHRLAPEPAPERLVEISNLSAADLAAAQKSAAKVDFRNTNTLLAHGEGALAAICLVISAIIDRRTAGRCRRGRTNCGKRDRWREYPSNSGSPGGSQGRSAGRAQGADRQADRRRSRLSHGIQGIHGEPQEVPRPDGFRTGPRRARPRRI